MDFKTGFAYFAILLLAIVTSEQLNQWLDEGKETKKYIRDMYMKQ
jgi:hypothetical protein